MGSPDSGINYSLPLYTKFDHRSFSKAEDETPTHCVALPPICETGCQRDCGYKNQRCNRLAPSALLWPPQGELCRPHILISTLTKNILTFLFAFCCCYRKAEFVGFAHAACKNDAGSPLPLFGEHSLSCSGKFFYLFFFLSHNKFILITPLSLCFLSLFFKSFFHYMPHFSRQQVTRRHTNREREKEYLNYKTFTLRMNVTFYIHTGQKHLHRWPGRAPKRRLQRGNSKLQHVSIQCSTELLWRWTWFHGTLICIYLFFLQIYPNKFTGGAGGLNPAQVSPWIVWMCCVYGRKNSSLSPNLICFFFFFRSSFPHMASLNTLFLSHPEDKVWKW